MQMEGRISSLQSGRSKFWEEVNHKEKYSSNVISLHADGGKNFKSAKRT